MDTSKFPSETINRNVYRVENFHIADPESFKKQAVVLANSYSRSCVLDTSFSTGDEESIFLCAFGVENELNAGEAGAFEALKRFKSQHEGGWMFGYLSYDLKNDTEDLQSENSDHLGFPSIHFFCPKVILRLNNESLTAWSLEGVSDLVQNLIDGQAKTRDSVELNPEVLTLSVSDEEYLKRVKLLKEHIANGDIYEVNYCREQHGVGVKIDPLLTYEELSSRIPAPFSCYYKLDNRHLICASPERFLQKKGTTVWSQPIKGTRRRSAQASEDEKLRNELANDPKERAENVMIVDLVRNDLSRNALQGSVKVDELCKIYSFPQAHQMISTISAELDPNTDVVDVIKDCFPMGSMTGAPKIRAMQLIEAHEVVARGLFSGAVGYFTPEDDFDFNVVIRSILYRDDIHYLSINTGGAITAGSDPESELAECKLKADALIRSLRLEREP